MNLLWIIPVAFATIFAIRLKKYCFFDHRITVKNETTKVVKLDWTDCTKKTLAPGEIWKFNTGFGIHVPTFGTPYRWRIEKPFSITVDVYSAPIEEFRERAASVGVSIDYMAIGEPIAHLQMEGAIRCGEKPDRRYREFLISEDEAGTAVQMTESHFGLRITDAKFYSAAA